MKRISKCQLWRLLKGYWASSNLVLGKQHRRGDRINSEAHSCPGRVRRHVRSWRKPTPHSKGSRRATYTVSSCPHLGFGYIHAFFKPSPRGLHIEQRTYGISTGTGSLELSVILFSPEIFTSNATSETATPSEHDAITRTFAPSSCNDLTVHF